MDTDIKDIILEYIDKISDILRFDVKSTKICLDSVTFEKITDTKMRELIGGGEHILYLDRVCYVTNEFMWFEPLHKTLCFLVELNNFNAPLNYLNTYNKLNEITSQSSFDIIYDGNNYNYKPLMTKKRLGRYVLETILNDMENFGVCNVNLQYGSVLDISMRKIDNRYKKTVNHSMMSADVRLLIDIEKAEFIKYSNPKFRWYLDETKSMREVMGLNDNIHIL